MKFIVIHDNLHEVWAQEVEAETKARAAEDTEHGLDHAFLVLTFREFSKVLRDIIPKRDYPEREKAVRLIQSWTVAPCTDNCGMYNIIGIDFPGYRECSMTKEVAEHIVNLHNLYNME